MRGRPVQGRMVDRLMLLPERTSHGASSIPGDLRSPPGSLPTGVSPSSASKASHSDAHSRSRTDVATKKRRVAWNCWSSTSVISDLRSTVFGHPTIERLPGLASSDR